MIVDAHHHFWDPTRNVYPFLTDELAAIRRPFGPDDLAPLLVASGIDATVLVQTRASLEETESFLEIAAGSSFIRGVVGWVDLADPAIDEVLARLRSGLGGSRLVAIRHQVQDEPDPDWLRRADVRRGIEAVGRAGLAYDLLVRARELPAAAAAVASLPDVRFVVDHLAKPAIRAGTDPGWRPGIEALATLPNVWWKVSGLVTEADWERWRPEDLRPWFEAVLDAAGPARLMVGSDWPVCLVAASYEEVIATARELIRDLSAADQAAILGGTAAAVYRLPSEPDPSRRT